MATHFDFIVIAVAVIIPLIAVQINLNIQSQLEKCRHSLNLTDQLRLDHNENILIFTRVPKTASLTINAILERLMKQNNFNAFSKIDGMLMNGNGNVCSFSFFDLRSYLAFLE